jgi:hypothetical protein
VRIEYDCQAAGPPLGDQSAFWLSDPADYQKGWLFGFGSNGNTLCKLLINGEEAATAPGPKVEPGRRHHVIAQVLADGTVQLMVDDQLAINHKGPTPTQALYPGLWSWGNVVRFAKVRIYRG